MFETVMQGLRAEAERVGQSNYLMLANEPLKDKGSIKNRVSGNEKKDRQTVMASILSVGGITGMMGVAVANQAAALGTGAVLTKASAALMGLGSVAIGSAAIPVVTVATLGAAAVGAVLLITSQTMRVDYAKGARVAEAVMKNDLEALKMEGAQRLTTGNWLKGTANYLMKAIREIVPGQSPYVQSIENDTVQSHPQNIERRKDDLRLQYFVEDVFSSSVSEGELAKEALIENVADKIWQKHGLVADAEQIKSCLESAPQSRQFVGNVIEVDKESGLVYQSMGRGRVAVHHISDFAKTPEVGKMLEVSYKNGVMQNDKGPNQTHAIER